MHRFDNHSLIAARARPQVLVRMLAGLMALVLLFQLIGATQHHHDLKFHYHDCASCAHAAQLHTPPPDPVITEQLARVAVLQYTLPVLAAVDTYRSTTKPVPRAQGPPATVNA